MGKVIIRTLDSALDFGLMTAGRLSVVLSEKLSARRRLIKYIFSGGFAAFINLGILYVLTDWFGIWYLISASLSFILAFIASFSLQKYWTFSDGDSKQFYRQLTFYFTLAFINLFINALLMYVQVDIMKFHYILAEIFAGILLAFESYFISRIYIFNQGK